MTNTVLICGSDGFIGRHAVSAFRTAGWKVFGAGRGGSSHQVSGPSDFRGDFRDEDFVGDVLERTRPARIVFAAGPSSVEASFANPVADFANQVLPLMQVLDSARRMKTPVGVLLVSSAAVYGNPMAIPVGEDAATMPISPYGYHKLLQESLLDQVAALYGLPTCKARLFSTYGPGLRHLAVWDITRRALKRDFTMEGSTGASRDYLHVTDVARALERICSAAPFGGESINVASGVETTIEQVATLIYEALDTPGRPDYTGPKGQGKPLRWCADVGRLRSLGVAPGISLKEGLRQTIDWIKDNA